MKGATEKALTQDKLVMGYLVHASPQPMRIKGRWLIPIIRLGTVSMGYGGGGVAERRIGKRRHRLFKKRKHNGKGKTRDGRPARDSRKKEKNKKNKKKFPGWGGAKQGKKKALVSQNRGVSFFGRAKKITILRTNCTNLRWKGGCRERNQYSFPPSSLRNRV